MRAILCALVVAAIPFPSTATPVVQATTGVWKVAVSLKTEKILVHEPVIVRVEWMNMSTESQLLSSRLSCVKLCHDGWEKEFKLFVPRKEMSSDSSSKVWVKPNEIRISDCWVLLGCSKTEASKWNFILNSSGKYQIWFPEIGDGRLEFEVFDPKTQDDVTAQNRFSVVDASLLLGENATKESINNLKAICLEFGKCTYAPYAAYALANALWREQGSFLKDFSDYKSYLDLIIERNPSHTLKEEAMYLLARGFAFQKGKKDAVQNVLERLAQEFPNSQKIKLIESSFGVKLGQKVLPIKEKPVWEDVKPSDLKIEGSEKIPEGPRVAFSSYWQAIANRQFADAGKVMHSSFIGSHGNKKVYLNLWAKQSEGTQLDAIRIVVDCANIASSFALPASLMSDGKVWTGEVCVVENQTFYSMTDKTTKQTMAARPNPRTSTVLLKERDGWMILSEYSEPTRNEIAGLLAQKLITSLSHSLSSVRLRESETNVFVFVVDKFRESKPNLIEYKDLSWHYLGLEMKGLAFDEPVLVGELRVAKPECSGAITNVCRARINARLVKDELFLVGVDVD